MKILGKELEFNNDKVYHSGNKPTCTDIGAAPVEHTHEAKQIILSNGETVEDKINYIINLIEKYHPDDQTPEDNIGKITVNNSFAIEQGNMLEISYTCDTELPSSVIFELRQSGSYLCGAYQDTNTGKIKCYTGDLSVNTYSNITLVAKEYNSSEYNDLAISNEFSLTISSSSSGGSSGITVNNSYTIKPSEMLEISYTTTVNISSYCSWELRQNNSYLCSAYKDTSTGKIVCYTGSLSSGTHSNITLVAKEYQGSGYVDIATSNAFSIIVNSSSDGSGGTDTDTSEYTQSCTSEYILDKMYPMGQRHEAIPNGNIANWKYNSRWENQYRPTALAHSCGQSGCPGTGQFKALGCWSNIYRVEGTSFSVNTGVEMKDIKMYGWYNGQWELVQHLPVPNGNFYAESFNGDSNQYFADSVKQTSTSKTVMLRENNKINGENCMYHPFSDVKNFDTKYQYIYTCIDLRKALWDENGVDDRNSTHYCSNCGGDWWLAVGLTFHDSWQHNKGVCQPKMIEITNEWRRFSMTTVPQSWTNGFPK